MMMRNKKVERNLSASRDGAGDQVHAGAALLEGLQGLIPGRMPNLLAAFYGAGGALAAASSEHGGRPCDRGRMPSIANGLRLILNCLVTVTFKHL
jgi:hypothetical protein